MNLKMVLTTAYLAPAASAACCHAFCVGDCLPLSVLSSRHRMLCRALGTARMRSGTPATTPSAFAMAPDTRSPCPSFFGWKSRVERCGYW